MARQPITPSSATVLLQPQATPVDTFMAPPRSNGLQDLADALATVDPGLQEFMAERGREQKDTDTKRADALFIEANQVGFAEATRRGLIPAHASPTLVKRYKQLTGDAIGRRLRAGWASVYDQWADKGTADEKALDNLRDDYIREHIGTDDEEVLAAALPHVRELAADAEDTHTRYRSAQFRQETIRANLAAINSTLDDADLEGLATGRGTDYAATGNAIERQREAYIASGGTASDFDENGMKLIAAKAVELRDPRLLDFFKRKVPGADYTYGDTPTGSALQVDAMDKLETIARAQVVDAGREEEKQRKAQADAATRTAIDALVAGEAIPEDVLAAGSKADADFRVKVGEWKANLAKGLRNGPLVRQIKADIMDRGSMGAVMSAASGIESPEDLDEVVNFAKSFEGARPTIDDILGSASAKTILGVLDSRTKTTSSFLDPVAGMTQEGLEAQFDFRRMVQDWAVANPNASAMEREEAVGRIGKLLTDRLAPSPDDPKVQVYNRDASAVGGFENPYSPAPVPPGRHMGLGAFDKLAPEQQQAAVNEARRQGLGMGEMMQRLDAGETFGAAPAPASKSSPTPDAARGGEVLPPEAQRYLEGFSPEEQAKIRKGAEGRAGGLPSMLDHLQRSGMKPAKPNSATAPSGAAAPDGTPINPTSFDPSAPDEGGTDARPLHAGDGRRLPHGRPRGSERHRFRPHHHGQGIRSRDGPSPRPHRRA